MGRATHVMIVDSEREHAALARISDARTDLDVDAFDDWHAALVHAQTHEIDLAIVDVMCSALCTPLRALQPHTSLVIVATVLSPVVAAQAQAAGASRCVLKPYNVAALVRTLRVRERRATQQRQHMLIEAHSEVAANIAQQLARQYGDLIGRDEVRALANLGLVEAAKRYDSTRAEPFIAFAERRIRGAVLDELRRHGAFSRDQRAMRRRIADVREQLVGRATTENIAEFLGVNIKAVRDANVPSRVDVTQGAVDTAATPQLIGPDGRAVNAALMRRAFEALGGDARSLLERRYLHQCTFRAIAEELGVTVAHVQTTHDHALAQLRAHLRLLGV